MYYKLSLTWHLSPEVFGLQLHLNVASPDTSTSVLHAAPYLQGLGLHGFTGELMINELYILIDDYNIL